MTVTLPDRESPLWGQFRAWCDADQVATEVYDHSIARLTTERETSIASIREQASGARLRARNEYLHALGTVREPHGRDGEEIRRIREHIAASAWRVFAEQVQRIDLDECARIAGARSNCRYMMRAATEHYRRCLDNHRRDWYATVASGAVYVPDGSICDEGT